MACSVRFLSHPMSSSSSPVLGSAGPSLLLCPYCFLPCLLPEHSLPLLPSVATEGRLSVVRVRNGGCEQSGGQPLGLPGEWAWRVLVFVIFPPVSAAGVLPGLDRVVWYAHGSCLACIRPGTEQTAHRALFPSSAGVPHCDRRVLQCGSLAQVC